MSRFENPYRGRLAPWPTGYLHLGHARTFWVAQERARANGGKLILRNEDLDSTRFKMEFVDAMIEDLRWFGFEWSEGPDSAENSRHTIKVGELIFTAPPSKNCTEADLFIHARARARTSARPRARRTLKMRNWFIPGRAVKVGNQKLEIRNIPGASVFPTAKPFRSPTAIWRTTIHGREGFRRLHRLAE